MNTPPTISEKRLKAIVVASLTLFTGLILNPIQWVNAQDPKGAGSSLPEIRTRFGEMVQTIGMDIQTLVTQYEGALQRLEDQAKEQTDLNLLVAIRKEKEAFSKREAAAQPEFSSYPKLAELQRKYTKQRSALEVERNKEYRKLVAGYNVLLKGLKDTYTRDGKVDEALEVQSEIEKVAKNLADLPSVANASSATGLGKLIEGRTIRIELDEDTGIAIAEVEVLSGGKNIATSGKAKQSTTHGHVSNPSASKAIDGNTDGNLQKGSVSHTKAEADQWWEVDLGAEKEISSIVIWARTDEGGRFADRLNGFRLSVLDDKKRVVWSQEFPKAPSKSLEIKFGGPEAQIDLE